MHTVVVWYIISAWHIYGDHGFLMREAHPDWTFPTKDACMQTGQAFVADWEERLAQTALASVLNFGEAVFQCAPKPIAQE